MGVIIQATADGNKTEDPEMWRLASYPPAALFLLLLLFYQERKRRR
jgi:hypothetical protein